MNRMLLTALTTATIAAGASAAQADAASYLQSPTGNIVCRASTAYYGPHLSCDVKSAGVSYNVDRTGRSWIGAYHGYDYGRVASYGFVFSSRGFRCVSMESGMTCRSTRSGHGFFLSREERYRF